MLGPLPKLYRVTVGVIALLLFVGVGAWAAFVLPYPFLISAGASVGLAVGVVVTFLLLRGSRSVPETPPVRRRRLD